MKRGHTSSDVLLDWNNLSLQTENHCSLAFRYTGSGMSALYPTHGTVTFKPLPGNNKCLRELTQLHSTIYAIEPKTTEDRVSILQEDASVGYRKDALVDYMAALRKNVHYLSIAQTQTGVEHDQLFEIQEDKKFVWRPYSNLPSKPLDRLTIAIRAIKYFAKKYVHESVTYGISKEIEDQFEADIKKYPNLIGDLDTACRTVFVKALSLIERLEPDKLIFNFTGNDSLYFRFYKHNFRIHLEAFFVQEDEDDNIEAVATAYKDDEVVVKQFGLLIDVFEKIQSAVDTSLKNSNNSLVGVNDDVFLSY